MMRIQSTWLTNTLAGSFAIIVLAAPAQAEGGISLQDVLNRSDLAIQENHRYEAQRSLRAIFEEARQAEASAALFRYFYQYAENSDQLALHAESQEDREDAYGVVLTIYEAFEASFIASDNLKLVPPTQRGKFKSLFKLKATALEKLKRKEDLLNFLEDNREQVETFFEPTVLTRWTEVLYCMAFGFQPRDPDPANDGEVRRRIKENEDYRTRWEFLAAANAGFGKLPRMRSDSDRRARRLKSLGVGA